MLDLARFPTHRQPTNISNYEKVVLYAVGKKKVFAVQRRAGGVRIKAPSGPVGSVTHRWPHEMDVETFGLVENLSDAPLLADVLPGFMETYGKKFRNGSHWQIDAQEFEALETEILAVGEGERVPNPPSLAERGYTPRRRPPRA